MNRIAPLWKWLLVLLLATLAIVAAFHFDGAVRHWVVAHPNRSARHWMQLVSRLGDWPEHVLLGILIIAFAWLRGSKRWVRLGLTMIVACALAGIEARGVEIATGRARPPGRGAERQALVRAGTQPG